MQTTLKKRAVIQAILTTLSTAALTMPIITMGLTLDVQGNKAVPDGEGGDALLFPIYTTTGGAGNNAVTSFSIVNQSLTDTIVIKIRFREQKVSVDALDFLVVMSPNDEFAFWVAPGDNGRPVLEWDDNTCVIGPQPDTTSVSFPDPAWMTNSFGVTNADLAVGNLEVLGVAALNKACVGGDSIPIMWDGVSTSCTAAGGVSLAAAARHNAQGYPAYCQVLSDFFSNPSTVRMANENSDGNGISDWASPTFLPAPNALVGRYLITLPGRGIEDGGDVITIQNANVTHGSTNPAKYGGNFVGLVTAQSAANCSDYGNCMSKYAWDQEEYSHPHLGEMANLANLQRLMSAASLSGDWNLNPAEHASTDWVVTFPTKYAYMDFLSSAWFLLANTPTGLGLPGAWVNTNSPNLALSGTLNIWGSEEQVSTSYTVSPGGSSQIRLFNVINVISFNKGSFSVPSLIQTDANHMIVTATIDASSGWAYLPTSPSRVGGGDTVTGLTFITRDTDNAGNNASITSLGATPPAQLYTLQITKAGTGAGLVTSGPAGINCGTDCTEAYRKGTAITLTATPTNGFFSGWGGNPDCSDGQVTIDADKSCAATFGTLPDFVTTAITLNPIALVANSTFTAAVTVKNQGAGAGDGGQLRLWVNQPTMQTCAATGGDKEVAVGTLAAGASKILTLTGIAAGIGGAKTLRVYADAACTTVETSETNNQLTQNYRVTGNVDFVVTALTLTPATPVANGTFTLTATVKNQGTLAGEGGYLDVWSNQTATQTCGAAGNAWTDIGNLAAGATKTLSFTLPAGIAGTNKTARAVVDSWCETTESNEGNNQLTKIYNIQ